MREAIGNTFIVNLLLVFLGVMSIIFIGSISYSKAFKAKNRIIYAIEKYGGWDETGLENPAQNEIDASLKQIGYPLTVRTTHCSRYKKDGGTDVYGIDPATTTYRYCVYEYNNEKGHYYGVTAFMHFDIPLIGGILEFPVYGETKPLYTIGTTGDNNRYNN